MSNDNRNNINDLNDILKLAGLCESMDVSANRIKRGGVIDHKELDESEPDIIGDDDDLGIGGEFDDELELDLPAPKTRGARQEQNLDKKYDDWYWGDKEKDFSESIDEAIFNPEDDTEEAQKARDAQADDFSNELAKLDKRDEQARQNNLSDAVDEDYLIPREVGTSEEDLPDDPLSDDGDDFTLSTKHDVDPDRLAQLSAEIKKVTSGQDQGIDIDAGQYEFDDDDRYDSEGDYGDGEEDYTDYSMRRGEMGMHAGFDEAYQRKTEDEFTLQGNYGQGWEDLTSEKSRKDILRRKREYEENEGGNYRTIVRKVKKNPVEENKELSDILRLSGISEGYDDMDNNNPDYTHYVVVQTKTGPKIMSGWEYREDAKDALNQDETKRFAAGIVHKSRLGGIDPNDNSNWLNHEEWLAHGDGNEIEEADYDDSNGYDSQEEYYANDTFPRGNHGSVSDAKGPASARYGDNPLQSRMMETKQIQKDLWESLKLFKESDGGTCSGSIAGVAKPLGKTQKRVKEETNNKYENADCKMKPYKAPKSK